MFETIDLVNMKDVVSIEHAKMDGFAGQLGKMFHRGPDFGEDVSGQRVDVSQRDELHPESVRCGPWRLLDPTTMDQGIQEPMSGRPIDPRRVSDRPSGKGLGPAHQEFNDRQCLIDGEQRRLINCGRSRVAPNGVLIANRIPNCVHLGDMLPLRCCPVNVWRFCDTTG